MSSTAPGMCKQQERRPGHDVVLNIILHVKRGKPFMVQNGGKKITSTSYGFSRVILSLACA